MKVAESVSEVRAWVNQRRGEGRTIGLVPTMGFLHDGHLSLVKRAKAAGHAVVMSIFVNPLQFGPGEDYDRYPRDLARDRALAERTGVDLLFTPSVREMYPRALQVTLRVGDLANRLCGLSRPGHFDGVATVVAKLFHIVEPDEAFFGEKDYQQLRIIQTMAEDLNLPVKVIGCPTVREADGLAMSSRNRYLSPEERRSAAVLSRALFDAARRCREGTTRAGELVQSVTQQLSSAGLEVEYVSAVREEDLGQVDQIDEPCRLLAAVRVGDTRLIDNVALEAGKGMRHVSAYVDR
ncbi:MAG: pantoate--beta-alanine ligase [Kyrpidia tusciae]|nr:pantoate--beta-alanine ligase [Kyrpidia tusciae]MBE3553186.1 pantoate--beta-alanine ligase [Kyrpidia tusciae]